MTLAQILLLADVAAEATRPSGPGRARPSGNGAARPAAERGTVEDLLAFSRMQGGPR